MTWQAERKRLSIEGHTGGYELTVVAGLITRHAQDEHDREIVLTADDEYPLVRYNDDGTTTFSVGETIFTLRPVACSHR